MLQGLPSEVTHTLRRDVEPAKHDTGDLIQVIQLMQLNHHGMVMYRLTRMARSPDAPEALSPTIEVVMSAVIIHLVRN